ncbi:response regulator transcription factor [Aliibacillus thermotolerans]|uniref:Response regulator transcription factor n=1 Tax=Aliibacillus thermotolerans TaxID=1834418 RepID=A0ABW0UB03_9BACI|nr:response regulator transcription factor [Aliibacillus thermotolerans]MDA3130035.1 response regulator [Aliibacillus thermotolerans]
MSTPILVVEDEAKIRQLVKIYLEKEGYEVWEAGNGEMGMDMFLKCSPCLIILDLMLPKMNGIELCKQIRQDWKHDVPIIMLTAKIREEDRVAGLQAGADDYVIKPFSPRELVARVEAVLRRTEQRCNKISYNGLTIKLCRGEVWLHGRQIHLTQSEFRLLHFFMQHPNQILSREQLLEQLYPNGEKWVMERTIDVHIGKLREKLEDNPSQPKWIQTVRGMGYKFVAS